MEVDAILVALPVMVLAQENVLLDVQEVVKEDVLLHVLDVIQLVVEVVQLLAHQDVLGLVKIIVLIVQNNK